MSFALQIIIQECNYSVLINHSIPVLQELPVLFGI